MEISRIVEGDIETFWDSVELMLFVYALAAAVSIAVAWILKLIFTGIQMRDARAGARIDAPAKAPLEPGKAAPHKTD